MTKYWTVTKFLFELRKAKLLNLFREFEKLNPELDKVVVCNQFMAGLQSFKQFLK